MQVGLATPETSLPVLVTTSEDGLYRFQLLADESTVTVEKRDPQGGWELTYTVLGGDSCSCPGFAYRAECKHAAVARGLHQWWSERWADTSTS